MSLITRFEEIAGAVLSGVFKKTQAKKKSVAIAKELVTYMHQHKRMSGSQTVGPNVYRVFLCPDDWRLLANSGETLLFELSKYTYLEGQRFGYAFLTKPAIELHANENLTASQIFIEVDFDDSIVVEWKKEPEEGPIEKKKNERARANEEVAETNFAFSASDRRNQAYFLEIMEGPDKGKGFTLRKNVIYLGRHSQCDITLSDPEVSRRHAELTMDGSGWLLNDLGSTNGTWVNGKRILRHAVVLGDIIHVGQTKLMIKQT